MDTEGEANPCLVLAGVINISQNTNSPGPGQIGWIIQQYRFFTACKKQVPETQTYLVRTAAKVLIQMKTFGGESLSRLQLYSSNKVNNNGKDVKL